MRSSDSPLNEVTKNTKKVILRSKRRNRNARERRAAELKKKENPCR